MVPSSASPPYGEKGFREPKPGLGNLICIGVILFEAKNLLRLRCSRNKVEQSYGFFLFDVVKICKGRIRGVDGDVLSSGKSSWFQNMCILITNGRNVRFIYFRFLFYEVGKNYYLCHPCWISMSHQVVFVQLFSL